MNNSYHIFYFPFQLKENKKNTSQHKSFFSKLNFFRKKAKEEINHDNLNWQRVICSNTKEETISTFDIKSYYHSFVHRMIFDDPESPSIIKHYKRKECGETSDVRFEIILQSTGKGDIIYNLQVDEIAIDLYSSTIGILSIFVKNNQFNNTDDVTNINFFGRYLYKSYWYENSIKKLSFTGLCPEKEYVEIPEDAKESWKLAGHIKQLLDDFQNEYNFKNTTILPVFNNKMFVSCYYYNPIIANKLQNSSIEELSNNYFWQNFTNIDENNNSFGCQNAEMRKELCKQISYLRWQNSGTLYGVSNSSFVCITNSDADFLYNVMKNIYPYIIKIILFQRASFLSLLDKISLVSENLTHDTINDIYKTHIDYTKNLYFKEITPQIQGIELYEKLQNSFKIKELVNELNTELSEIHNYLETKSESEKTEDQNNILNLFAAICLPASLVAGVFGMNSRTPDKTFLEFSEEATIIVILSTVFLIILLLKADYRKTLKHFFGFNKKKNR